MKSLFLIGLTLSLLAAGPSFAEDSGKLFHAETFTLSNGLQVVVIPNHRAPVVTHMLWVKVGAADEPQGDGVSGAAHFLEHLMFKGSKAIKPGQFSKLVRQVGGNDNAFTSWDYTAFFQSVPKEHLGTMMALEADRMINIAPLEKDVRSELSVIIEERRQRTDNDPRALFSEQLRSALFAQTPYAVPIIGWKDEMPKLEWDHLHAYYRTWYAPNNAILVVSGDITPEEMKPLAEKYYGFLPKKDVPPRIRPATPDFPAPITMTMERDDIREPSLIKAWRAPSSVQSPQESLALEILQEALDGGASTRLYQSFVVQKKLAVGINLSYDGDSLGDGSLWLSVTPAEGVSFSDFEKAFGDEISSLIETGLSDEEIEEAKTRLFDSSAYARDSVAGPAMIVGQALSIGFSLDDIENWPQEIKDTPPSLVRDVLKKYLSPSAPAHLPVTGYLLPDGSSSSLCQPSKDEKQK
jgi:zinc protease